MKIYTNHRVITTEIHNISSSLQYVCIVNKKHNPQTQSLNILGYNKELVTIYNHLFLVTITPRFLCKLKRKINYLYNVKIQLQKVHGK